MALLIIPLELVLGRLSTTFPHPGGIAGFSSHATIAFATMILVASVLLNMLEVEISGRTVVMVVRGISAILLLTVITTAPHVRLQNFPLGWVPVGRDLALLFWPLVGWDMLAHMAEEFRDPGRKVMRAMLVPSGWWTSSTWPRLLRPSARTCTDPAAPPMP